jgi:hypothetical protein
MRSVAGDERRRPNPGATGVSREHPSVHISRFTQRVPGSAKTRVRSFRLCAVGFWLPCPVGDGVPNPAPTNCRCTVVGADSSAHYKMHPRPCVAIGRGCRPQRGFNVNGFGREIPPLQRCADHSHPLVMERRSGGPPIRGSWLSALCFRLLASVSCDASATLRCDHSRVMNAGVEDAESAGLGLLALCFRPWA